MADNIRTLAEQALADAERATPGPWFSTDGCCVFVDGYNLVADAFASAKDHPNGDTILAPWSQPQCAINAQVIAAARTREPQLAAAVLEREYDMHARIRAGYDTTVADAWRAEVAKVTAERDEARAALVEAQEGNARLRETYKNVSSIHADRAGRMDAARDALAEACRVLELRADPEWPDYDEEIARIADLRKRGGL